MLTAFFIERSDLKHSLDFFRQKSFIETICLRMDFFLSLSSLFYISLNKACDNKTFEIKYPHFE